MVTMDSEEKPWLISVGAGTWQLHGIQCAVAAGVRVLALDGDKAAPGLSIAHKGLCVDIRDEEVVIAAIEKAGINPAGVISICAEVGMSTAAGIRERFHLPGPDKKLTLSLTNKWYQRKIWTAAGLPCPVWKLASSMRGAEAAFEAIQLPTVVKPVDNAGSRGVRKVTDRQEWEEAAKIAFEFSPSHRVLVESFIDGKEYTVESFSENGNTHVLTITEKAKVPSTGGMVAIELATPNLSNSVLDNLASTAIAGLAALGYQEGPGHTEIILSPDGEPVLIETAGRGGGFMVFDKLIPMASGFDIATACVKQAVGQRVSIADIEKNFVVLRFFPSTEGVVMGYTGFDQVNKVEGISAGPFVKVGDKVKNAHSDGDRLGYVLTHASTPEEAKMLADKVEPMIKFQIQPN